MWSNWRSKSSPKKGCFVDETNRTSQENSDSYKTDLNAKKCACNEARRSEKEHVGMCDSMRKVDFEHSNEESNVNSSDEEENQLPMCGRKGDAENLNEKEKTLIKTNTLEDVSVGQKVRFINTMRKKGDGHTHQKI